MPKTLSECEVKDLIQGATILGTGGGGDPKKGLKLLEEDFLMKRNIAIIDPLEIHDDAVVVCSYQTGSIAPISEERRKAMQNLPKLEKSLCEMATEALAKYIQREISAIVPVEIGGQNTAEAIHVATKMGIPTVDGDLVGRAVPDDEQTSYYILGLPMPPIAVSDHFGDIAIITKVMSDVQAEMIVRAISVSTGGGVGTSDHPFAGKIVKNSIVPRTLTLCMNIGKTVRESQENNEDPLPRLVEATRGDLLFQGIVDAFDWNDRDGFMYGNSTIRGTGKFDGALRIWFKNENNIAWLNDEPVAMSPDLICVVDRETGQGITNTEMHTGLNVAVIGIRAAEILRTERGISVLGPRHYGFDLEYEPIERLSAKRKRSLAASR
jgi:DUF917 family protein